jgi:hypothetical protein
LDRKSTLCSAFGSVESGLTYTLTRISSPLMMPPSIPPAWFVFL